MGVELIADKGSKRPFDPPLKLHAKIKAEAMSRGLMVYPMGGTVDGVNGDHVLLAPPFIASQPELDVIVERLASSIDAGTAALKRAA
jgi:adenosylmethionine-8-amino-7-oxononanoate aminotransferase